eukprot:COSAG06_NODE_12059_length_1428_cov_22.180587_1_plen_30_part_01
MMLANEGGGASKGMVGTGLGIVRGEVRVA